MKNNVDAKYYDDNDLSGVMKKNKAQKKVYKVNSKRVTMNISFESYNEATRLDRIMGMGYQNVLKAAIFHGLRDLQKIAARQKHHISKK